MMAGSGWIALMGALWLGLVDSAPAMELIAHRCGGDIAPENTLAAARRCIELGIPWVEIDVRQSRDGVFYLLHDSTVDRTTDGTGMLAQLDSSYVDTLDAGAWFHPRYAGERVPRLQDFLAEVRGKLKVFVDFKTGSVPDFVNLIRDLGMWEDMLFSFSFSKDARRFRELAPDWPLKVFARTPDDVARLAEQWKPAAVECYTFTELNSIKPACSARGIKVMFFTARQDPDTIRTILAARPDMLGVNDPQEAIKCLTTLDP